MKHLSTEDLSAYIDGEARDAAAVAAHLRGCTECARRHSELAKVSAHVRALPVSEAPPAFAGRVMARVRASEMVGRSPWRWLAPALAAAAVALVGAAVFLRGEAEPARQAATPSAVPTDVDPERLMGVVEARLARGEDPAFLEENTPMLDEEFEAPEAVVEELVVLANTGVLDGLSSELDADEDVDSLLATLSPDEAEALRQMLMRYSNEG